MRKYILGAVLCLLSYSAYSAVYVPDSGWQAFHWNTGAEFNYDGPFTFTVLEGGSASLDITDIEYGFERFEIFNFGVYTGVVTTGGGGSTIMYTSDFQTGYSGSNWGSNSWNIGEGDYSLTFRIASYSTIYENSTGGFRVEGDLAPVPIPPAVWLFASGLIGFVGLARRKGNA